MAIICSNCQNYSYSAYKTLCTLFVSHAYFMAVILVSKRKSQNSIYALLTPNNSKMCNCCLLFLVTSHFIQPQKMCKGVAYGINLIENGGLFYKIQPKMCAQWWSLLGRSRCFHSFIQDLLEDVSFCSSWLDLGEEWGSQFLLVHTDYRRYFLVLMYTYHCTTFYLASLSSDLKTSALATC